MVQEKKLEYCKALVELNEMIKHMSLELQNKIPQEIKQEFIKNMDKQYHFTYDETLSLEKQNIMPETQGLLSVIYSNYLCSEEERKKWKEYDNFYKQEQQRKNSNQVANKEQSTLKEVFPKKVHEPLKHEITNQINETTNQIQAETKLFKETSQTENIETKQLTIIQEKNIFRKILDKLKLWFSKK